MRFGAHFESPHHRPCDIRDWQCRHRYWLFRVGRPESTLSPVSVQPLTAWQSACTFRSQTSPSRFIQRHQFCLRGRVRRRTPLRRPFHDPPVMEMVLSDQLALWDCHRGGHWLLYPPGPFVLEAFWDCKGRLQTARPTRLTFFHSRYRLPSDGTSMGRVAV